MLDNDINELSDAELEKVMKCVDDDYLMNIFQEIQSLYRSTLYKLVNLS